MKKFVAAGLIACSAILPTANAAWEHLSPGTTAPNTDSRVTVQPPIQLDSKQWVDVYFPNTPGGLTPATIANTTCILVYFHGGSFLGGDPRDSNEGPATNPMQTMISSYVGNSGCLLISMSYPLNESTASWWTIQKILNGPEVGSVYGAFDEIYTKWLAPWKAGNPNIRLYTTGISAGALIAQRIATDGRWAIDETILVSPPVVNPRYVDETIDGPLNTPYCDRDNPQRCEYLRNIWSWSDQVAANPADLSYYHTSRPQLVTNVLFNACDDVVDLRAAVVGYFNRLTNVRISVHKGYTKSKIREVVQNPALQDFNSLQHGAGKLLLEEFFTGVNDPSKWAAWQAPSVLAHPLTGDYKEYCSTGNTADDHDFRLRLIN